MKKLVLLLLFLISPLIVSASGKMIVSLEESVILNAESDLKNPEYTWTLIHENKIIDTQSVKQFSYMFNSPGKYLLNLIVKSKKTAEIENTSVEIIVGASNNFKNSLNLQANTLPKLVNDTVFLTNKNLSVSFVLSESQGDIKEYRIDTNINIDTDNDGDPANDIDNLNSNSLKDGLLWEFIYQEENLPTTAKLSILDKEDNIQEKEINIKINNTLQNEKLTAVLDTYPQETESKRIALTGDKQKIFLFPGNSLGNILEYRIDTNIKKDTDNDGDPANDIDNLTDNSFKNGSLFAVDVHRSMGDIIMQLIIVSAEGKGSKIQRKFVWETNKKLQKNNEFRLVADNNEIFVGETVHFSIEGFSSLRNFEIKWDFNGDKESDFVAQENSLASYKYDSVGDYTVLAQIKNESLKLLKYANILIKVKEKPLGVATTEPPISDFNFTITDNIVKFENTSLIDKVLDETSTKFTWKFGDGNESQEKNPTYKYNKTGNFIVRLTVKDASDQESTKNKLININSITTKNDNTIDNVVSQPEEELSTDTDLTSEADNYEETFLKEPVEPEKKSKIYKYIIIIIVIFSVICIGGMVYFIILKIKHPDYTFGEILEEEKEKLLSILEGRKYEPPVGEIVATEKEVNEAATEILKESDKASKIRNEIKYQKTKMKNKIENKPEEKTETANINPAPTSTPPMPSPVTKENTSTENTSQSSTNNINQENTKINENIFPKPDQSTPNTPPSSTSPTPTPQQTSYTTNNAINSKKSTEIDDDMPDWLKNTPENNTNSKIEDNDDIPDWLK